MMKRAATIALCCLTLTACGGSDDDRVNAAAARTFNYGPAEPGTPPDAAAALESLVSFQTAAGEETAIAAQGSLMSLAFEALGDEFGLGGFPAASRTRATALVKDARSQAFAAALRGAATQFTTGCTVVKGGPDGTTTVVFSNCVYAEDTSDGGELVVRASGQISGRPGFVEWNVKFTLGLSSGDASMTLAYHDVGDFSLTSTSAVGHQEADVSATVRSGAQSAALGLAQSVDLDVTLDASCEANITGGTLEAKRVWTRIPSNAPAEEFADRGVLFAWIGCGVANVQFSL